VGSNDRRVRGTTSSTSSSSKPSRPHHRADVLPYNAAFRPSDMLPARTLNSHVLGVARCRKTRSDSASQTPSSIRSHHCCDVKPHTDTSSRLMRSCCLRASSISSRSFLTPATRHAERSKAERSPVFDASCHTLTVSWTVAARQPQRLTRWRGVWLGPRRTRRRRRRSARACRPARAALRA
jgi:hypothetical protein